MNTQIPTIKLNSKPKKMTALPLAKMPINEEITSKITLIILAEQETNQQELRLTIISMVNFPLPTALKPSIS
jgi:hypothetical protein